MEVVERLVVSNIPGWSASMADSLGEIPEDVPDLAKLEAFLNHLFVSSKVIDG